jgi:hypothetical protein
MNIYNLGKSLLRIGKKLILKPLPPRFYKGEKWGTSESLGAFIQKGLLAPSFFHPKKLR